MPTTAQAMAEPTITTRATTTQTTETSSSSTTILGPPSDADIALVASETLADPSEDLGFAFFGKEVTKDAPTLTVSVGEEVTIWVINEHGQYSSTTDSHNFAVVPKLDDIPTLAATGALGHHILWDSLIEKMFRGESGSVTFVPDVPGEYYFLCTIPGHAAGGMMGLFVVTE